MSEYVLAMTTVKDMDTARKIVDAVLHKKLAACANIIPGVQSKYWWRDQITTANELIIIFKTRKYLVEELKELVLIKNTYEVAEFIVLPIIDGSMHYLSWIDREVKKQAS